MAAAPGNTNALGNTGGKSLQDRKLSAQVRSLALSKILAILARPVVEMNQADKELHDQILLKLTGNILPRLNEHSGEDGGVIRLAFDNSFSDINKDKDGTTRGAKESSKKSSPVQDNKSGAKVGKDKSGSGNIVLQGDSFDEETESEEDELSDRT